MKIVNLAEVLKDKRRIVRFVGVSKHGRRPAIWSPRLEILYEVLLGADSPKLISELLVHPELAKLYGKHHGNDDLRRELCWLVQYNMARWELVDGNLPAGEVWIREPAKNERSHGFKLGETDWISDGVILETPSTTWVPRQVTGVIVRRLDTPPHGKSHSYKLWACVPESRHCRPEEIHLTTEAEAVYNTPWAVFMGLIELVKGGHIEMLPLGVF